MNFFFYLRQYLPSCAQICTHKLNKFNHHYSLSDEQNKQKDSHTRLIFFVSIKISFLEFFNMLYVLMISHICYLRTASKEINLPKSVVKTPKKDQGS